jgi:Amt family ammonium transporter
MLNGILAGLVSIAGPCAVVEPYAAVIIGILGGLVYYGAHHLLLKLKIDDPLDASAVHFFCGAWGLIAAGLFATEAGVTLGEFADSEHFGAFYGGGGEQLGVQCVGLAAIAGWTLVTSGILFAGLKTMGMLRLPPDEEISGLDHPSSGAIDFNAVMPTGGAK